MPLTERSYPRGECFAPVPSRRSSRCEQIYHFSEGAHAHWWGWWHYFQLLEVFPYDPQNLMVRPVTQRGSEVCSIKTRQDYLLYGNKYEHAEEIVCRSQFHTLSLKM